MTKQPLLIGTSALLILGAFTLFISSCSKARSFEVDGIKYEVLDSVDFACKVVKGISIDGSVVIPDSVKHRRTTYIVTEIGDTAFIGCTGLTEVIIPNSVTEIGDGAFSGCEELRSITSLNPQLPVCNEVVFYDVDASACALYVPKGSKKAYSKAEGWKDFGKIVEMQADTVNLVRYSDGTIHKVLVK